MKSVLTVLIATFVTAFQVQTVFAHVGNHAGETASLMHFLLSPNHLPLYAMLGAAIVLSFVIFKKVFSPKRKRVKVKHR